MTIRTLMAITKSVSYGGRLFFRLLFIQAFRDSLTGNQVTGRRIFREALT
jgi:hypothetical protein